LTARDPHATATTLRAIAIAATLAVGLAACGGGGGGGGGDIGGPGGGGGTQPANVQSIAVFGDSYSDLGSFRWGAVEAAGGGRFTTNPGPVWVETIAAQYGVPLSAHLLGGAGNPDPRVLGGTSYAQGGSRIAALPGVGRTPSGIPGVSVESEALPLSAQVDAHLARGPIPETQLILLQGGTNDVFYEMGTMEYRVSIGVPRDEAMRLARAAIADAADDLVTLARRLADAGATRIVYLSMPDPSLLLFANGQPADVRESVSALAAVFNAAIDTGLASVPGVLRIDIEPLFRDMLARPEAHGLREVRQPACTAPSPGDPMAIFCTAGTLRSPDAAEAYLFADGVHLTTAGNRVIARQVMERIAQAQPR
jgi:phospholipase/lecithinase/hemolysin